MSPQQATNQHHAFTRALSGCVALLCLLAVSLFLSACASSQPEPQPAKPAVAKAKPATTQPQARPTPAKPEDKPIYGPTLSGLLQFEATFDASVEVLRDYGFSIDRQDYRFGTVTTRPLVAPTVFEPWKPTNTSNLQIAEGTFNSQRRIARVELKPIQFPITATSKYQLTVQVYMIKLQQPLRYLNRSTTGFGIISIYSSVPAEWREKGITRAYWLADGTDPLLARRIADDIAERAKLK